MILELALHWEDVQRAATAVQTCIAVGNGNHDRAKEDWEQHPSLVEYWINQERTGYARVIRLSIGWPDKILWLLDYARPFNNDYIQKLMSALMGNLMIQYPTSDLKLPTAPIFLPALERPQWLKYAARSFQASEWVIAPCKAVNLECREAMVIPEPIYDD